MHSSASMWALFFGYYDYELVAGVRMVSRRFAYQGVGYGGLLARVPTVALC